MGKRCSDHLGRDRCEKALDHPGFHRRGAHMWGFAFSVSARQRAAAWERLELKR